MKHETTLAALATVLLLVGSLSAGVAATPASGGAAAASTVEGADHAVAQPVQSVESPDHNETAETADEIYVTEDGDLVLVYREESDSSLTGQFGVNVSEGLFHVLLSNETDSNVTGDLRATLTREQFVGNGSLVTDRPEEVRELNLQASTVQTADDSRADVSLQATVTNESAEAAQASSMATKGQFRVTPSTYQFSASVTADGTEPVDEAATFEASVTETATGYRMDIHRNSTVSEYAKPQWDSRKNATRTLEARYDATARQLNGTAEVTVESYEFVEAANDTYRVDVAYTVEYRDVHESVSEQLTRALTESENLTLTEDEAEAVSEKIQEFDVEELSLSVDTDGTEATMSTRVHLENYDALSRALLDVAASAENVTDETREQITESRKKLNAVQESGLVRTGSWSGSMATDGQTAEIDFELQSRTENWAAYVQELEARDLGITQTEYEVSARTVGDEIEAEVSATMTDDELVANLLRPGSGSTTAAPGESSETLKQLRQAGFEQAKLDASLTEGEVTVESAGEFENMSALQDALSEAYAGEVRSVVGRTVGGEQVTYVRVTGAVGSDPSEADVRDLPVAGEETEIKMPGEWDREFPTMKVEAASTYLGYEPSTDDGDDGDGGTATATDDATADGSATPTGTSTGVPGFGVVVALAALAAAAALFGRD